MAPVMSTRQLLDYYTEQVNAAVAADRDDLVRDLTQTCGEELAERGITHLAA
jgi:hypothetical protein